MSKGVDIEVMSQDIFILPLNHFVVPITHSFLCHLLPLILIATL